MKEKKTTKNQCSERAQITVVAWVSWQHRVVYRQVAKCMQTDSAGALWGCCYNCVMWCGWSRVSTLCVSVWFACRTKSALLECTTRLIGWSEAAWLLSARRHANDVRAEKSKYHSGGDDAWGEILTAKRNFNVRLRATNPTHIHFKKHSHSTTHTHTQCKLAIYSWKYRIDDG